MAQAADVILLGGDLTDRGLPEEAHVLVREMAAARVPILAVFGNHDCESGHEGELTQIFEDAGVMLLDGDSHEIHGVGFAGVKGFIGGFGNRTLGPWGEHTIKQIVHETIDEALKLEAGLAKLQTQQRIVLLHYAPIRATVEGEPPEIFPFLGSSRLEDPFTRLGVTAAFHGHAHVGAPEGRATGDIPVFNVALPVLARSFPGQPPYRIFEVPTAPEVMNGHDPVGCHAEYTMLRDLD
jgi:Icc-related predicted phosphoesterase